MSGRILALDLLRGYFLFVIIIDHLFRVPGIFELFTGRGQLWVSAAEGFFIISGLLVGLIYTKKPMAKIFSRAGKLYFWSITLTLLFTLWGHYLPISKINSGFWSGPLDLEFFIKLFTFQYVYGWADYLSYYVVFMLFAPLALALLRRGLWPLLIITSLGLWFFGRSASVFLAWQPLFFLGLLVGFYFTRVESSLFTDSRLRWGLIIITLVTLLISSATVTTQNTFAVYPPLFDKITLGFGRLVLSWIWIGAAYLLVRRHEQFINRLTFGFFALYGRNSLFVYGLHAVLLFPVNFIILNQGDFLPNVLVNLTVLVLIYLLTSWFERLSKYFKTFR